MNATIFNNETLRLARDYFGLSQTSFGKKLIQNSPLLVILKMEKDL